jgi:UDP-glucose 4-epimerase
MKYLITGGAGFIGSHLAEELLARGHAVHVLDDLSTGSVENIRHLSGNSSFSYTVDSCLHDPLVGELVDDADAIFHLAAAVGVRLVVTSPVHTIETNVHSTEIVLSHAARKGCPVLIASTSEVYGKSRSLPFRESGDLVMGPTNLARWSYACSKAIDEFLALAYHRERHLPVMIGRLFNTVGPRQTGRYGMVVPTFVRQALGHQAITVFGDGSQRRCFCHVGDVVDALATLMEQPSLVGEVFNIGSTQEIAMMGLARRIKALCESTSEIVLVPYDEAYAPGFEDMHRRVPDVSKLERAIGWRPTRCLDEILTDVIDSCHAAAAL